MPAARSVKLAMFGALCAATLTLSACTGSGAFPSASPTPSATVSTPAHSADDRGQVAVTYETFLNGLYSLNANQQTQISQLFQQYTKRSDFTKLSAAQQAHVVATVRGLDPALSTLDVRGLDAEQQFLISPELLALGAAGSPSGSEVAPQVRVAEAKVTVKGAAASVPLSALSVSAAGGTPVPYPTNAPIVAQVMPFAKIDGRWLIDAQRLAAEAASNPAPTPKPTSTGK